MHCTLLISKLTSASGVGSCVDITVSFICYLLQWHGIETSQKVAAFVHSIKDFVFFNTSSGRFGPLPGGVLSGPRGLLEAS